MTPSGLSAKSARGSGLTMEKPFAGYRGRRNLPKALGSRRWPLRDLGHRAGPGCALFVCGKRPVTSPLVLITVADFLSIYYWPFQNSRDVLCVFCIR